MRFETSPAKWRPFCPRLNALRYVLFASDDDTTENPYATYIYGSETMLDRRRSDVTKEAADGGKYDVGWTYYELVPHPHPTPTLP